MWKELTSPSLLLFVQIARTRGLPAPSSIRHALDCESLIPLQRLLQVIKIAARNRGVRGSESGFGAYLTLPVVGMAVALYFLPRWADDRRPLSFRFSLFVTVEYRRPFYESLQVSMEVTA